MEASFPEPMHLAAVSNSSWAASNTNRIREEDSLVVVEVAEAVATTGEEEEEEAMAGSAMAVDNSKISLFHNKMLQLSVVRTTIMLSLVGTNSLPLHSVAATPVSATTHQLLRHSVATPDSAPTTLLLNQLPPSILAAATSPVVANQVGSLAITPPQFQHSADPRTPHHRHHPLATNKPPSVINKPPLAINKLPSETN